MTDDMDFDLADMLKRQAEAGIRPEWAMNPEKLDEEMNKVPLFMNQLPTDFENNDVLSALQSLIYDGTPEGIISTPYQLSNLVLN